MHDFKLCLFLGSQYSQENTRKEQFRNFHRKTPILQFLHEDTRLVSTSSTGSCSCILVARTKFVFVFGPLKCANHLQIVIEMSGEMSVEQQIIAYVVLGVLGMLFVCPCIKPLILAADRRLHSSKVRTHVLGLCACACA